MEPYCWKTDYCRKFGVNVGSLALLVACKTGGRYINVNKYYNNYTRNSETKSEGAILFNVTLVKNIYSTIGRTYGKRL